ncbi:recombinase family protein [Calidifontibacillus oryziterrae]|uniref:recombinase family protein n=1 Tax=Calidifontibacillus oryziterrae TaxID=1191699 RepID=UPI000302EFD7|nr:recombinase family protein [Calidifontibacillus oryziterrae]
MRNKRDVSKRTAIYVRVSTTKMSQKDSPEHQIGVCKDRANQEGLEVHEEYIYRDSDTGTTITDRPAIQELMIDARKGMFDSILFASLSRFARDTGDALALKRRLVDAFGIRLISIDEGYDSEIDKDELKFTIISAVNQKLSEQISYSSKRGKRQSGLKGNFTGSIPPFGYKKRVINGRKTLEPDENTMHIVQKIFQLYTSNKLGEKEIVNYLNNVQKVESPKKKKWGITTIQRILQNEAYIGRNVFSKYEVKKVYIDSNDTSLRKKVQIQKDQSEWLRSREQQTHQPIIDEEIFNAAQQIRLERGGGRRGGVRNRINVFAGMIKCKHCGASMVSMKCKNGKNPNDGREYRYLTCSQRRRQGDAGCDNNYWLPYFSFRDDLINQISNRLKMVTSAEQLLDRYKDSIKVNSTDVASKIKKIEKNINMIRTCLSELRKEKMLGKINEDQYEFERKKFEQDIQSDENRLNEFKVELQKQQDLTVLYQQVKDTLDELLDLDYDNFDEMNLTLRKLIKVIEVDKNGNIDVLTTFGIPLNHINEVEYAERT